MHFLQQSRVTPADLPDENVRSALPQLLHTDFSLLMSVCGTDRALTTLAQLAEVTPTHLQKGISA